MSVSKIKRVSRACETSEGHFRFGGLEDGKYALVEGDIPPHRGDALPIQAGNRGEIHRYSDLAGLEREVEALADTSADAGDEKSAERLRAVWAEFSRLVPPVRRWSRSLAQFFDRQPGRLSSKRQDSARSPGEKTDVQNQP